MQLSVIAIGRRMPDWVAAGWQTYQRRMPPHLPLSLTELHLPGRQVTAADEGQALLAKCPTGAHCVALDGGGQAWSTEQLAQQLADWQLAAAPVCFLIGGAEGLDQSVLNSCAQHWSLGPATYPHMLVRVLIAEQLYRAHTLLVGHPYHRGAGSA